MQPRTFIRCDTQQSNSLESPNASNGGNLIESGQMKQDNNSLNSASKGKLLDATRRNFNQNFVNLPNGGMTIESSENNRNPNSTNSVHEVNAKDSRQTNQRKDFKSLRNVGNSPTSIHRNRNSTNRLN